MLPQHRCCRVTGVSSFGDKDWCQTPTELVWGRLMPSFPCLSALFICPLFLPSKLAFLWSKSLENVEGKLGRLLFDMLHMWFHFSWPGCGALGAGNHVLTDLYHTRLWGSLASAWRQIDPCRCTHYTNTQACLSSIEIGLSVIASEWRVLSITLLIMSLNSH